MKKPLLLILCLLLLVSLETMAQCAMCTKTAAQLGEKPAAGMNTGILYLMATPFVIMGYLGFRWWKSQKSSNEAIESGKL
jgi:hypothetical protein